MVWRFFCIDICSAYPYYNTQACRSFIHLSAQEKRAISAPFDVIIQYALWIECKRVNTYFIQDKKQSGHYTPYSCSLLGRSWLFLNMAANLHKDSQLHHFFSQSHTAGCTERLQQVSLTINDRQSCPGSPGADASNSFHLFCTMEKLLWSFSPFGSRRAVLPTELQLRPISTQDPVA